jgi:hypothetical protein
MEDKALLTIMAGYGSRESHPVRTPAIRGQIGSDTTYKTPYKMGIILIRRFQMSFVFLKMVEALRGRVAAGHPDKQ